MFVISPMSNIGSLEKRDIFLQHISDIADTTIATELDVLAYAWFCSADDNTAVPRQWVRGFEVYKTLESSTVQHRSSDAYKRFRAAVGSESLLDRPSDLRYMRPLDIGFLTRPGVATIYQGQKHYETAVQSFWALEFVEEANDPTVLLFQRYESKEEYESALKESAVLQQYR
ncbi:uncharacterized protein B0I36DRAFT_362419 [Microdochium trichocladiopsis]|uniref:Uncharacterized protein n=1 Tax=Microdochium trichocladiopsis TaxID=1682393 RepID=A0A9P8Y5Y6_9PEZI|nr:uncharacterized protein B0I36DRAFT_362419 [Microdochium trichocladiopsis]KAH7030582.1 hypothetical protein B0I36DRAFT_362419 [Microdochium trichocladiopsis]